MSKQVDTAAETAKQQPAEQAIIVGMFPLPISASEEVDKLIVDLIGLLNEQDDPLKDTTNPAFKSKYADLDAVFRVTRKICAAHRFGLLQAVLDSSSSLVIVRTVLIHASGQWIATDINLPVMKGDPQGIGSAITYAKRYGAQILTGRASEDDDGNAASKKPTTPATPAAEVKKITEAQALEIAALIQESKANGEKFRQHFGFAGDLTNLPADRYEEAIEALKEQKRRVAEMEAKKAVTT